MPVLPRRRWLLWSMAGLLAGCAGGVGAPRARVFSLAQIQTAVERQFPLRKELAYVAEWTLPAPRLHLLPDSNQLGAALTARVRSPLAATALTVQCELQWGLRYDRHDQALHATQVKVRSMRIDGLQGRAADLLQHYATLALQHVLQDLVLYRLPAREIERLHAFGLEPGAITVLPEGVRVQWVELGGQQQPGR